jgi:hypothetical protein
MNPPNVPGQPPQGPGLTLTVSRAHNAIAAIAEMYAGAIADIQRENEMLKGQIVQMREYLVRTVEERNGLGDALKKLREERSAERVAQVVETRVSTPPENGGL